MSAEGFSRRAGEQVGSHTLVAPLGRGGFSEVWRATGEFGEEVALKLLIHPEHLAQLRQEASALSLVRGQGIVPIRGMGLADDPPWIALELLAGGNLRRRMRRELLPPSAAIVIFERILDILARVHREGIVHGDLKPENVLFAADGEVFLADFGLSRRIAQRSASLSVSLSLEDARLAGTLDYMAPEQRSGEKPSARSDVFAAGVILYELLTGERPQGVFKMPSEIDPALPPVVDRLIACSLAQDPRHRFASAAPMAAYLRAGVTGDWRDLAAAHRRLETLSRLSTAGQASDPRTTKLAVGIALGTMSIMLTAAGTLSSGAGFARYVAGSLAGVLVATAVARASRPWLEARFETIEELKRKVELQIRTGGEWSRAVSGRKRTAPAVGPRRSQVYPPAPKPASSASAWVGLAQVVAFLLVGFGLIRACSPSRPPVHLPPTPIWTPPRVPKFVMPETVPLAPSAFPLTRYGERVEAVATWSAEPRVGEVVAVAAVGTRVWTLHALGVVRRLERGGVAHNLLAGVVEPVRFAAAPGRFAVAGRRGGIAVFEDDGRVARVLERRAEVEVPSALALSEDGRFIAYALSDRLRLVEVATGRTLREDTTVGAISAIAFGGDTAVAVGPEGAILRASAWLGRAQQGFVDRQPTRAAGVAANGAWVAGQERDGSLRVVDPSGTQLGPTRLAPLAAWLGVAEDGDRVLLLDRAGQLHLHEARLGAGAPLGVGGVAFATFAGGSRFAAVLRDGAVTTYDVVR